MRALTMDELSFVSGGTEPAQKPAEKPKEKPKEEQKEAESIVVFGLRTAAGVGGYFGAGWISVSLGSPGVIIQPVEPANPDKPEVKIDVQIDAIDVKIPVNTSVEARRQFWNRAFGTPPGAIQ